MCAWTTNPEAKEAVRMRPLLDAGSILFHISTRWVHHWVSLTVSSHSFLNVTYILYWQAAVLLFLSPTCSFPHSAVIQTLRQTTKPLMMGIILYYKWLYLWGRRDYTRKDWKNQLHESRYTLCSKTYIKSDYILFHLSQ